MCQNLRTMEQSNIRSKALRRPVKSWKGSKWSVWSFQWVHCCRKTRRNTLWNCRFPWWHDISWGIYIHFISSVLQYVLDTKNWKAGSKDKLIQLWKCSGVYGVMFSVQALPTFNMTSIGFKSLNRCKTVGVKFSDLFLQIEWLERNFSYLFIIIQLDFTKTLNIL